MFVTASEVCQKLSLGFQTKGIKTISFRSPEHTENDIDELAAAAENQFIILFRRTHLENKPCLFALIIFFSQPCRSTCFYAIYTSQSRDSNFQDPSQ
jgi:hypothetical protein